MGGNILLSKYANKDNKKNIAPPLRIKKNQRRFTDNTKPYHQDLKVL